MLVPKLRLGTHGTKLSFDSVEDREAELRDFIPKQSLGTSTVFCFPIRV